MKSPPKDDSSQVTDKKAGAVASSQEVKTSFNRNEKGGRQMEVVCE